VGRIPGGCTDAGGPRTPGPAGVGGLPPPTIALRSFTGRATVRRWSSGRGAVPGAPWHRAPPTTRAGTAAAVSCRCPEWRA